MKDVDGGKMKIEPIKVKVKAPRPSRLKPPDNKYYKKMLREIRRRVPRKSNG